MSNNPIIYELSMQSMIIPKCRLELSLLYLTEWIRRLFIKININWKEIRAFSEEMDRRFEDLKDIFMRMIIYEYI